MPAFLWLKRRNDATQILSISVYDVQADFSYFFDTGGRRRCYIAPERLYESNTPEAAASRDALLEPAMVSRECSAHAFLKEPCPLPQLLDVLAFSLPSGNEGVLSEQAMLGGSGHCIYLLSLTPKMSGHGHSMHYLWH